MRLPDESCDAQADRIWKKMPVEVKFHETHDINVSFRLTTSGFGQLLIKIPYPIWL